MTVEKQSAWHDRFATPSHHALEAGLPPEHAERYQRTRAALVAIDGVVPRIFHMGIPWRWTICFIHPEDDRFAYLVPDPERPIVAIPFREQLVSGLNVKKLGKPVREGLLAAKVVGGIVWAEWPLSDDETITEILTLAVAKAESLLGIDAPTPAGEIPAAPAARPQPRPEPGPEPEPKPEPKPEPESGPGPASSPAPDSNQDPNQDPNRGPGPG